LGNVTDTAECAAIRPAFGKGVPSEPESTRVRPQAEGSRTWPCAARRCVAGIGLAATLSWPVAALAAEVRELGTFGDWGAYVVDGEAGKLCFARTEPRESKGDYTSRDETALTISHRPGDRVRNEVSVLAGYTYKEGSRVELAIGGKKFFLFVDGDAAWAESEQVDSALVQELEKGSTAVVKGTSSRGTLTTDTYSLRGSSAALGKISEACAS